MAKYYFNKRKKQLTPVSKPVPKQEPTLNLKPEPMAVVAKEEDLKAESIKALAFQLQAIALQQKVGQILQKEKEEENLIETLVVNVIALMTAILQVFLWKCLWKKEN